LTSSLSSKNFLIISFAFSVTSNILPSCLTFLDHCSGHLQCIHEIGSVNPFYYPRYVFGFFSIPIYMKMLTFFHLVPVLERYMGMACPFPSSQVKNPMPVLFFEGASNDSRNRLNDGFRPWVGVHHQNLKK
jgi:hypothetical protein